MCVYVYIYMYMCICVCVCMYVHVHVYVYVYVYVYACMYVYVCIGQVFDGYDRPVMRHITEYLHNKYTPEKCRGTHHDWLYG